MICQHTTELMYYFQAYLIEDWFELLVPRFSKIKTIFTQLLQWQENNARAQTQISCYIQGQNMNWKYSRYKYNDNTISYQESVRYSQSQLILHCLFIPAVQLMYNPLTVDLPGTLYSCSVINLSLSRSTLLSSWSPAKGCSTRPFRSIIYSNKAMPIWSLLLNFRNGT